MTIQVQIEVDMSDSGTINGNNEIEKLDLNSWQMILYWLSISGKHTVVTRRELMSVTKKANSGSNRRHTYCFATEQSWLKIKPDNGII